MIPIHSTRSPTAPPDGTSRLLLGLVALLAVAATVYFLKLSHRLDDFEVYARAASRALAGEPLYRPEDGHWLFKYLPAFAVVAIPVALIPLPTAKLLWFLATVATLIPFLRMTLAIQPERLKPSWLLVVATIVVMGDFYGHELRLGQTNLLMATAVVGAVLAMRQRREALAGGLVVVAIVLKPYAVLLLPWLLARRRYAAVVAAAIGTAIVMLLPLARYGLADAVDLHVAWWQTVTTSVEPNLLNIDNISWLAMYSRWFGTGARAEWLALLTIVAAAGVAVYVFRLRAGIAFPEPLEAVLLLTLMPLMSPQGWEYTLLTATPAVMLLVNYSGRLPAALWYPTIGALTVIGLSIYDLMGRTMYTAFMRASGVTIAFFIVLAALVTLRVRRVV